jgi:hypothetical protein
LLTQALPPATQLPHTMPPAPQTVGRLPGWHAPLLQQPAHPDAVSQTHAPPEHRRPAAHALPVAPHTHAPAAVQVSAVNPQLVHAEPDTPQAAGVRVWQVVPLQQPAHPDAPSHTQAPLVASHRCPKPHVAQATPPLPHALACSVVTHCPPAVQQPFGHEVASHTHAPAPLQRCPAAQVGLRPQRHSPPLHWLLWVASQATQLAPPVPQVARDCP